MLVRYFVFCREFPFERVYVLAALWPLVLWSALHR